MSEKVVQKARENQMDQEWLPRSQLQGLEDGELFDRCLRQDHQNEGRGNELRAKVEKTQKTRSEGIEELRYLWVEWDQRRRRSQ
jgi:hypothetical protein